MQTLIAIAARSTKGWCQLGCQLGLHSSTGAKALHTAACRGAIDVNAGSTNGCFQLELHLNGTGHYKGHYAKQQWMVSPALVCSAPG